MAPFPDEYVDRKLKPIWDELGKLHDHLEAHSKIDSDEHRKIIVLQVKGEVMEKKVDDLIAIEKGRTGKLIAVVGCVTAVILAAAEVLKFIFHR